eukprot:Skav231276  [mRNA]  locus=scaffold161:41951:44442:+ [translate_table: standard]
MGLEDLASVFPVAGLLAVDAISPVGCVRPAFREQLISILASRFPDSVHPCDEENRCTCVLRCLEDVGVHLGFHCADAIIAARQALTSIGWSEHFCSYASGLPCSAPRD